MSEACLEKTTHSDSQRYREPLRQSPYIATTTEAIKNYKENWAGVWFKENVDASDPAGNFAFQRLRHTWFTPRIDPKFRLRRDDKFYAIGSCFVRGLENALKMHKVAVESAAPELARLQPAKKEISPIGFANKYNTYSILNELRWALDPARRIPARVYCPIDKDNLGRPTHDPDLGVCRFGGNTRTSRANANSYKAHKELSRRDRHPWACGGVARRQDGCLRQSNSHSIFLKD